MNNLSFELIQSGEESYEVKITVICYLLKSYFIWKICALIQIHVFNFTLNFDSADTSTWYDVQNHRCETLTSSIQYFILKHLTKFGEQSQFTKRQSNDCTLCFYVQVVTGQIRQLLVEIKYGNSLTFLVT